MITIKVQFEKVQYNFMLKSENLEELWDHLKSRLG
jgi:hypothetical protein